MPNSPENIVNLPPCAGTSARSVLIPFLNHSEIRREAADSAVAPQGHATTYRHDLEME
ncbi:hypothetical protein [Polaromonas sp. CG9_12]|nr:hypothetical protein [Polaromonas sp. CG9_12]